MDSSPLSRLPPELRNYIYELALPTHPVRLNDLRAVNAGSQLHICREWRQDVYLMFWTTITLYISIKQKVLGNERKCMRLMTKLYQIFGGKIVRGIRAPQGKGRLDPEVFEREKYEVCRVIRVRLDA